MCAFFVVYSLFFCCRGANRKYVHNTISRNALWFESCNWDYCFVLYMYHSQQLEFQIEKKATTIAYSWAMSTQFTLSTFAPCVCIWWKCVLLFLVCAYFTDDIYRKLCLDKQSFSQQRQHRRRLYMTNTHTQKLSESRKLALVWNKQSCDPT